jgi:CRP-like cAMP-binding protein
MCVSDEIYKVVVASGSEGITSEEILKRLPQYSYPTVTARYAGLKRQGRIVDTGRKIKAGTGRRQAVLVAAIFNSKT